MAKIKSRKATPVAKKGDERGYTEMVMLLIITLGLAITTIMAFVK